MKPLSKLYRTNRRCNCGKRINDKNKSGKCKPCLATSLSLDPELRRRRGETVRRKCQIDPLFRARKAAVVLANKNAGMSDPEKRARMLSSWRANLAKAFTPEALAKKAANQAAGNRKLSERRMAWCPPEYRDFYRFLTISKKLLMAEAKKLIFDQIESDRAKLSPFERQERALAKGAQLVANDQRPSLGNPGIYRAEDAA